MGSGVAISPLSYRTTARTATGETPFSLAFRAEALIPAKVKVPSFRYENFNELDNDIQLAAEKDMIEERREVALIGWKLKRSK